MDDDAIHWYLPPVVGEIYDLQCIIICEPKDVSNPLLYIIDNDDAELQYVKCSLDGPTQIIILFHEEGYHLIKWVQNGIDIYEHSVYITDNPQRFIFVSCDLLEADVSPMHSMWNHMTRELVVQKPTALIHLGDQAYMDAVFNEGLRMVRANGRNDLIEKAVVNMFKKRYQDTWIPHHQILAGMSNYFLWDDHEIKNNMMLTDKLSVNKSFVRNCAVLAYNDYQCSATLNDHFISLSKYSWYKEFDNLAMVAIERTSRFIQVNEIISFIKEIKIDRLLLCFSAPVIPGPHDFYGCCYRGLTNDKGTYATSKFFPLSELLKLYRAILNWKAKSSKRDVILLGGDLHLGLHGIVEQNGISFPVVVASPITNEPTFERWLASKGLRGTQELSDGSNSFDNGYAITFRTISTKANRCYCVVNTDVSPMKVMMRYCDKLHPYKPLKYLKQMWNSK